MDEQLCPVDTASTDYMHCPKCQARSGDDWTQCGGQCPMPGSPHHATSQPHANERVLLDLVALHVTQAKTEYAADCPIAARLEITAAQRLLDRAFHGEAV